MEESIGIERGDFLVFDGHEGDEVLRDIAEALEFDGLQDYIDTLRREGRRFLRRFEALLAEVHG